MEMPYPESLPVQLVPCLDTTRMPVGSLVKVERYHNGTITNEYAGVVKDIEDSLQAFTLMHIDEFQNEEEVKIHVTAFYKEQTQTGYDIEILATPPKRS